MRNVDIDQMVININHRSNKKMKEMRKTKKIHFGCYGDEICNDWYHQKKSQMFSSVHASTNQKRSNCD